MYEKLENAAAIAFAWAVVIFVAAGAILLLTLAITTMTHAQSPVAIVGQNGQITYIYPGTNNQPNIVTQPNGAHSYVYPMGPSAPPVALGVVPIYTPPAAYQMPSPFTTLPSYGGR